jgi:CelD/BcsL family acetyltransferase involved in cellulose biosynthesis
MKHVLDQDRVVEVDYLTGDDPYKRCWMTRRRERIGILACNLFTFEGLASAATEVAGSVGSSVLRRGARSLSHFSVAVAWMQSFAECLIVCGI